MVREGNHSPLRGRVPWVPRGLQGGQRFCPDWQQMLGPPTWRFGFGISPSFLSMRIDVPQPSHNEVAGAPGLGLRAGVRPCAGAPRGRGALDPRPDMGLIPEPRVSLQIDPPGTLRSPFPTSPECLTWKKASGPPEIFNVAPLGPG